MCFFELKKYKSSVNFIDLIFLPLFLGESGLWFVNFIQPLKEPAFEIQPVHSEGDQPWDFFGRNDAKAETPVLWLPHVKS